MIIAPVRLRVLRRVFGIAAIARAPKRERVVPVTEHVSVLDDGLVAPAVHRKRMNAEHTVRVLDREVFEHHVVAVDADHRSIAVVAAGASRHGEFDARAGATLTAQRDA